MKSTPRKIADTTLSDPPRTEVAAPLPEPVAEPRVQSRAILRDLFIVATVGAGIWVANRLGRILLMLVLAMFLAYVIAPLVELVQHPFGLGGRARKLSRGTAIALVYLLLAGGTAASAAILWPSAARQIDGAIADGPAYTERFHVWERGWAKAYERLRIPIELRHSVDESVLGAGDAAADYAHGSLLAMVVIVSNLPWLLLVPVFAFLLLKDVTAIRRTLLQALPHRVQLRGHRLLEELSDTFASYVRAQMIACVIVGTLCGVGFALLGNPYAILLGCLAAVFEFIPLIGPLFVAVVAVAIAAFHSAALAVWTGAFLLVVRGLEDYVIYPRLIGRNIHLHPLVVILAVLAGAELGGIAGIFIAVPLIALGTVIARHWLGWRSGDAPPPAST
jgi:predicted PurR-regulated permease PerM